MVTAGAAASGSSVLATHHWTLEQTPNPAGADISSLAAVACPSRRLCTAVGSSAQTLSSPTRTLAERWAAGRWRIQPIPTPTGTSDTLSGVSCPTPRACMTVGSAFHLVSRRQTTLAEAWNGRRWRALRGPRIDARDSALYGVSCASARSCTAVGYSSLSGGPRAIVERWNGRSWRRQAIPRQARSTAFFGVSCSGARACTAVGASNRTGTTRPFAMSWNGKRWRIHAVPLPQSGPLGAFDAVSCTSPRACTATGLRFSPSGPDETLAERWNGRTWRTQQTPNPPNYTASFSVPDLQGVSCTSARACTAVGAYSPGGASAYFIVSWNGKRWRLEPAPHPAGFARGALLGISCVPGRCTAVGAYTGTVRLQQNLAMSK